MNSIVIWFDYLNVKIKSEAKVHVIAIYILHFL